MCRRSCRRKDRILEFDVNGQRCIAGGILHYFAGQIQWSNLANATPISLKKTRHKKNTTLIAKTQQILAQAICVPVRRCSDRGAGSLLDLRAGGLELENCPQGGVLAMEKVKVEALEQQFLPALECRVRDC